ncbi:MAG TPA: tRNA (5-methylaminomethyl-2-thiouridine)(34)-methyltransferase MnmD [Flavobacteriaceae bacterium]|nr:tRNA (5-methylaminomethyl-2-thiouridine)(34)-methyltransferase MnmD [Flavobacteriaceae bacterium]
MLLKKKLLKTGDGSTTLHLPKWNEQYHSKHGAIQEALHVFIKHGFQYFYGQEKPTSMAVLEIGFGTGLNALLTYLEGKGKKGLHLNYTGLEAYPVPLTEIDTLNFAEQLGINKSEYMQLHSGTWEKDEVISDGFSLTKKNIRFEDFRSSEGFDLIYFDAFGPRVQPELWETSIFEQMFAALKPNGVLVTYSAKGEVRRIMQRVGFTVERLPGPPGKREMLRAVKKV